MTKNSEQQKTRTYQSRAPMVMMTVMVACLFGMFTGYIVGSLVGYPEPLSLFGVSAPIVVGIVHQLIRIRAVKADA